MSHLYSLTCEKCGDETNGYNFAEERLIRAVETSYGLWILKSGEWDLANLDYDCFEGVASFIVKHFTCDAFLVVSEYWRGPESEEKFPRKRVRPLTPETHVFPSYLRIVLEQKVEEAKALAAKLVKLAEEVNDEHGCLSQEGCRQRSRNDR